MGPELKAASLDDTLARRYHLELMWEGQLRPRRGCSSHLSLLFDRREGLLEKPLSSHRLDRRRADKQLECSNGDVAAVLLT
eukprot:scaffold187023_cov31-Tisochrysis_lutea.AAC.4